MSEIKIAEIRCKGCGRCVLECPRHLIELSDELNEKGYQYAVFNNNSDRSARSLSIPVPSGLLLTNVHFHDVDYHSGEPYSGTDWAPVEDGSSLTWSTSTHGADPDANALRWGKGQ